MTQPTSPSPRRTLTARLLFYVVLCSSLFTVAATAIQLYFDYRRDVDAIHESLRFIEKSYLQPLASSAYDMDKQQLQSQLNGALKLQDIEYLEVVENDGGTPQLLGFAGTPPATADIRRDFILHYPAAPAGTVQSARLRVEASLAGVYDRLWAKGMVILSSNAIKTFFASLCIFVIIQMTVTRHLKTMAAYAQTLALDRLDVPLRLQRRVPQGTPPDELEQVVAAINDMRNRLRHDIEQRITVEQALRDSEENLRITLDSIGDAVIATDRDALITQMNPVAEELTGWPRQEATGQSLARVFQVIHAETRAALPDIVRRVIQSGRNSETITEAVLVARDGTERRIADSAAPICTGQGQIVGAVLVFRDITEQHQLEEQLRHSQRMDSIGQLAGGVAHDFNNMLGGIVGMTELLARRIEGDKRAQEYTEMILQSAQRATDLTSKLLAFSRRGKSISTPFDVHDCIRDALALLRHGVEPHIKIQTELTAEASVIVGDPSQLQNAILNLGLNARDAMPDGGTLRIVTATTTLDASFCQTSPFDLTPGRFLHLRIEDTGTGIPLDIRERIFDPFFTTKEVGQGTGLGLAAVYGTTRDHHGAILVHSEPGAGTAFHLYLPLEEAVVPSVHAAAEAVPHGRGCILVIDDEPVIRTTAAHLLEDLGYEVLLASDGVEGLAVYEREQSRIRLVILDMVMPRLGGRDCFRAIRHADNQARVVLCSGFSRDAVLTELQAEGALGFLKKPFRRADVAQLLADLLAPPGAP